MFSLFNLKENVGVPIRHGSDWYNVLNGLKLDLNKIIHYYNTHTQAVAANHILMDVLFGINVPMSLHLDRYYVNVVEKSVDLSRALGFSSSVNFGRLFRGKFFSDDCVELIISVDEDFDYESAYENWRTLEPVKVIRHPFSSMGMPLMNGKKNGTDTGLCVLTVNIPMLCLQYRAFRYNERALKKENPDYAERTPQQFIHMYPLPNALRSYADGVLLNRFFCLAKGKPFGSDLSRHPFHITDWTDRLNKVHSIILDNLRKGSADFTIMLRSIPLMTQTDLEEYARVPDMALTRQIMMPLVASRLNIISLLLGINEESFYNNNKNKDIINRLHRFFTRAKYNNSLGLKRRGPLYESIEEDFDDIHSVLKIM